MNLEDAYIIFFESLLESLKAKRKEVESTVDLSNKMLKFQKFFPLLGVVTGCVFVVLTNSFDLSYIVYGCVHGLVLSLPIKWFSCLYWEIVKKKNIKKASEIDEEMKYILEEKKLIEKRKMEQNDKEFDVSLFKCDVVLVQEPTNDLEFKKNKKKVRKLDFKRKK